MLRAGMRSVSPPISFLVLEYMPHPRPIPIITLGFNILNALFLRRDSK